MAFDPDAYLATPSQPAAFDPDAYLGETAAPVAAAPSTLDVAMAAPLRGLAGVGDVLVNTPANIVNLGLAGAGRAMGAMGVPAGYLPGTVPTPPMVTQGLQAIGALPPEYQNLSSGQRVLQSALSAAGSAPVGGGNMLRNMALGGIGGGMGQATEEVTGSPMAGLAVGAAAPALVGGMAASRQASLQQLQQRNALRDQTLRAAQAEGMMATPGSVEASAFNRLVESLAGKTTTQQLMSVRNQEQIDRLARRAVGLAEDAPLNSESLKRVRDQAFDAGYKPIQQIGAVPTDANFTRQLDDVLTSYTGGAGSFPGAVPESVSKLVGAFRVGQFDSGDALKVMRSLRSQATANFRKGDNDLGKAQSAISNALEEQIERHLAQNPTVNAGQLLDNFRAARQRMAISHTIEHAVEESVGSVDARKLARDFQSGKYLTGDLKTIAAFASAPQFRGVTQYPVGTPGISNWGADMLRAAPLSAPVGYALGGPGGSVAAGLAGVTFPAAARAYLMSPLAQRRLLPSYNPLTNRLAAGPQASIGPTLEGLAELDRRNALAP